MKILFLLFLCVFTTLQVFTQIQIIDGKAEYVLIDSTIQKSRASLFKSAKIALVETFVDAKEVIQYEDKEEGDIVGKGLLYFYNAMPFNDHVRNTAKFSIAVNCREGKYRVK